MKKFLSIMLAILMVVTSVPFAFAADVSLVINMTDSYGDGWNGNAIQVGTVSGGEFTKIADVTFDEGATATYEAAISDENVYAFVWTKGSYAEECSFSIVIGGETVLEASDCNAYAPDGIIYTTCNHSFSDSTCSICELECGVDFAHTMNSDSECTVCGFICSHSYTNHYCKTCGNVENGYYAGVCGAENINDAIWSLDSQGTLTISGTGKYDVEYLKAPWLAYESSIKDVVIEEGITNIRQGSFNDLSNAVSLSIPSTVNEIGAYANNYFAEFKLAEVNSAYALIDGVLFNADKTELIMYPVRKADETYTVPAGVLILGNDSFSFSENLKTINISDDVTTINEYCFNDSSVETVNFGKNVNSIDFNAFSDSDIKNIVLPEKLTEMSQGMFYSCGYLENLVIGNNVISIDKYVIAYCDALEAVHFTGTEAQWEAITKPEDETDKINTVPVHFGVLEEKPGQDATCGADGHTAGLYCAECDDYVTGDIIPATGGHDWSNKDGICANSCGETCPHESYTDGVCDICGYECPHEWGEGVLTRPIRITTTDWDDGYYTYTCSACGHYYHEAVKRADYTALDAILEDFIDAMYDTTLLDSIRNELEVIYFDNIKVLYGDYIESEQAEVDALVETMTQKLAEVEAGVADGSALKPDYTEGDALINGIIEQFYDKGITYVDEIIAEFDTLYNEYLAIWHKPETTKPQVDEIVGELKALKEKIDKGTEDGTLVKIDGMKEYNKIADALDAELMENYSQEEIAALAEKAGDEINARFGEIIEKAEALTGTVAENKDALAEIESEMRALYGEIKNCLDGVHNGLVYEVTEEAKCEVNAIESATCTLCGETDEREVEGSALTHSFTKYEETEAPKCGVAGKEAAICDNGCGATDEKEIPALTHKDADGDYKCDYGCGHEFEKPAEPEDPSANCDHLCHSNNWFVKNIIWKIVQFFWKLFKMNPVCECGAAHY